MVLKKSFIMRHCDPFHNLKYITCISELDMILTNTGDVRMDLEAILS
jgi:hypothetical protein